MTPGLGGSLAALVTPLRGGEVDLPAFRALVRRQVEAGTSGLVVCGTTGEAPTLDALERDALLVAAREEARGLPVVAGVGTNATRTTVAGARRAAALGADALLVVTPYYNRPSQRGLLAHYAAVAEATALPVVLYNVPARTGVDLLPETALALAARHPSVVAIKEASGSLARVRALVAAGGLRVLVGDDALAADGLLAGAAGWVGVVQNLAPGACAALARAAAAGDLAGAREAERELAPLVALASLDVNPVPTKAALARLGLATDEVRGPLAPLDPALAPAVDDALLAAGLLATSAAAVR